MLGEMMQGLPQAGEPDLETQWVQTLKKPEIQAAMINFGVELMKPRWTSGSALPDALSAGARGYAGVQEEEFNRKKQEEAVTRSESEKAADRNTRLETARIGADSRAEVASLRTAGMLEGIRARNELKGGPQGGEEAKLYSDALKAARAEFKSQNETADLFGRQKISDQEIERRAAERAQDAVTRRRLSRDGAPAIPGDNPSANSATEGGPVGQPGATGTPKNTSANPSSPANKPSASEAISRLQRAGRWTGSPAQIEALRPHVLDPGALDVMVKSKQPPGQSTMEGF